MQDEVELFSYSWCARTGRSFRNPRIVRCRPVPILPSIDLLCVLLTRFLAFQHDSAIPPSTNPTTFTSPRAHQARPCQSARVPVATISAPVPVPGTASGVARKGPSPARGSVNQPFCVPKRVSTRREDHENGGRFGELAAHYYKYNPCMHASMHLYMHLSTVCACTCTGRTRTKEIVCCIVENLRWTCCEKGGKKLLHLIYSLMAAITFSFLFNSCHNSQLDILLTTPR